MCVVSVITEYGRDRMSAPWTPEQLQAFKVLIEQAQKFDKLTDQPNCEDPAKAVWIAGVEESVGAIKNDV